MNEWLQLALPLFILLGITELTCSDSNLNVNWESPDAFSQRKTVSSGKTSSNENTICKYYEPEISKDDHLLYLYKKITKFLLKRDSMKFDKSSGTFYRSLHLHITEEQLNRFEKMTDIRDMDQLIADVLYQSSSGTAELFQEMYLTWRDTFLLYWEVATSSRQIVIGIQFTCFVLIWFASRKFKFSFRLVALFLVMFYLYSFLDAECHRKKEIERVADMFGSQTENPCNTTQSFWSYYFSDQKTKCKQHLKHLQNSYDVSCSLIDIYEEFVNVFIYKQMWNFIENTSANILTIYATYGFLGAIVVTTIFLYLFNNYVKILIESLFKYIFAPFATNRSSNASANQINNGGDVITGEFIKKILDITSQQTKLNELQFKKLMPNSGVQEINVVDSRRSINEKFSDAEVNRIEKDEDGDKKKVAVAPVERVEVVNDVLSTSSIEDC